MSNASTRKLSPTEIMALVVLMAESREVRNPDLKALSGIDLSGAARNNLLKQGLVSERKVARANAFTLTPQGWATAIELVADQERLAGATGGALSVLLNALRRGLQQHGLSAEEFLARGERDGDEAAVETAAPAAAAPADAPVTAVPASTAPAGIAPVATGDPETQVRAAYRQLAQRPGAWVTLADLRDALPTLPRSDVDGALRGLVRSGGVQLIPVANLKSLQQRDRDAALRLGGEDQHVLSIEAA